MTAIRGRFPWDIVSPFTEQVWGFHQVFLNWIYIFVLFTYFVFLCCSLWLCIHWLSLTYYFLSSLSSAFPPPFSFFPFLSSVIHVPRCIFCKVCPLCSFQVCLHFRSFLPSVVLWALPAHIHYLLLPASFFLNRSTISVLLFSFIEVIAHSIF